MMERPHLENSHQSFSAPKEKAVSLEERGDFGEKLRSEGEKYFYAYAEYVYEILKKNPEISYEDFAGQFKLTVPLERPVTLEEQRRVRDQLEMIRKTAFGGHYVPAANTSDKDPFGRSTNFSLGGTGKYDMAKLEPFEITNPTLRNEKEEGTFASSYRKLYLSPDFCHIPDFFIALRKELAVRDVSLQGAKIHFRDFKKNDQGEFVAQPHNTLIIYCDSDADVPSVVMAAEKAQKDSGVLLHSFGENGAVKSPRLLDGRVIVGGSDLVTIPSSEYGGRARQKTYSFDQWTDELAGAVWSAVQPRSTNERVRVSMSSAGSKKKRWSETVYRRPEITRAFIEGTMKDKLSFLYQLTPKQFLTV